MFALGNKNGEFFWILIFVHAILLFHYGKCDSNREKCLTNQVNMKDLAPLIVFFSLRVRFVQKGMLLEQNTVSNASIGWFVDKKP